MAWVLILIWVVISLYALLCAALFGEHAVKRENERAKNLLGMCLVSHGAAMGLLIIAGVMLGGA